MFEAAAIDVNDGTQPCFPFLPPDFEEIERTVMIRNEYLTQSMRFAIGNRARTVRCVENV